MSTKDKVLLDLEKRKGVPVSGTIIANKLGVSRTAVWKAINALRAEGHVIKGGSGIGYVLDQKSDVLSEAGISDQLSEHIALHVFEEIDSTNKEAKRLAISEPSEPLLIIADRQTEGRGRFGRSFYSPSGTGLYMSLLFRPEFSADRAGLATAAASVAVCRAAKKVAGRQCGINIAHFVHFHVFEPLVFEFFLQKFSKNQLFRRAWHGLAVFARLCIELGVVQESFYDIHNF